MFQLKDALIPAPMQMQDREYKVMIGAIADSDVTLKAVGKGEVFTEAAALISLKAIDLIVNTKEWASNYKIELIGNELEKWRTKDDDSEN